MTDPNCLTTTKEWRRGFKRRLSTMANPSQKTENEKVPQPRTELPSPCVVNWSDVLVCSYWLALSGEGGSIEIIVYT